MAIDIGPGAVNLTSYWSAALKTLIDKTNPANETGTLASVEIWAYANLTGCMVGTFYLTGTNKLKCRASATIGNVTAGSKQTFTGLSIAVETGDYIGMYFATGTYEADFSGYTGVWIVDGQYIDPNDEATYTYNAGYVISLYGASAAAIVVTPGTLALTTTLYAPSVIIGTVVTPSTIALNLAFYAPTVTIGTVVTPGTLALSLTTYAPTIVTPVTVTPGTLALSLATYTPTVTVDLTLIPNTLALVLTTYAPNVFVGVIHLTLPLRSLDQTLKSGSTALTPYPRSLSLTPRPRSVALTFPLRSLALTLGSRSVAFTFPLRSLAQTPKSRSLAFTLPLRSLVQTLKSRSGALTLPLRSLTLTPKSKRK